MEWSNHASPSSEVGEELAGNPMVDMVSFTGSTATGRRIMADTIGEIVNTAGIGKFEGYYKNGEATRQQTRGGMYWILDL